MLRPLACRDFRYPATSAFKAMALDRGQIQVFDSKTPRSTTIQPRLLLQPSLDMSGAKARPGACASGHGGNLGSRMTRTRSLWFHVVCLFFLKVNLTLKSSWWLVAQSSVSVTWHDENNACWQSSLDQRGRTLEPKRMVWKYALCDWPCLHTDLQLKTLSLWNLHAKRACFVQSLLMLTHLRGKINIITSYVQRANKTPMSIWKKEQRKEACKQSNHLQTWEPPLVRLPGIEAGSDYIANPCLARELVYLASESLWWIYRFTANMHVF